MTGLKMIGIGRALPGRCVTNDDLSKIVDTNDAWISERTGIRRRYYCAEGESANSLIIAAAREAIGNAHIQPEKIDCVIVATVSGDYVTPSVACLLQAALGIRENIPVMDINAACAGFLYGTAAASGMLQVCGGRYALVVGGEQLSRLMDMTDRSTCVLFGDGAGAAVYERDDTTNLCVDLGSRGGLDIQIQGAGSPEPSVIQMNGNAVFRFAVGVIPSSLNAVLEKANLTMEDIDWVVCHQANARIIDHCAKKMGAPEKFYKNIDRYGNTSAASIPLALYDMYREGLLKDGQKVLAVGFGGGLTWAGALLNIHLGVTE
ncbi:beta-ketoacyl-ACP synthase III [uncultured Gemmiger sp.]|uniref:beta-ketoacyl-ACP synthase III n=1 Tax=uncultured Gemmiger sp. TaxID=1623490 RepID=UPI0025EADFDD|nr:beta-ketoacyl-ACP synthase III [uncultured Gemmiger sp.]